MLSLNFLMKKTMDKNMWLKSQTHSSRTSVRVELENYYGINHSDRNDFESKGRFSTLKVKSFY